VALIAVNTEKDTIAIKLATLETELSGVQTDLATEKAKNTALETALAETAERLVEAQNMPTKGASVSTKQDKPDTDWEEKTFKIGKIAYGFMVPQFGYKSGIVTYKDILADTTLQAELVEAKHALIIKK
jgi:hypothetical protein